MTHVPHPPPRPRTPQPEPTTEPASPDSSRTLPPNRRPALCPPPQPSRTRPPNVPQTFAIPPGRRCRGGRVLRITELADAELPSARRSEDRRLAPVPGRPGLAHRHVRESVPVRRARPPQACFTWAEQGARHGAMGRAYRPWLLRLGGGRSGRRRTVGDDRGRDPPPVGRPRTMGQVQDGSCHGRSRRRSAGDIRPFRSRRARRAPLREKVLAPDFRCPAADSSRPRARLLTLNGRHEGAWRWFAGARRVLAEQGAFVRRGGPGDPERAPSLLGAPLGQFQSIGMTGWVRRAEELGRQVGAP
jgi:hypothetical protein